MTAQARAVLVGGPGSNKTGSILDMLTAEHDNRRTLEHVTALSYTRAGALELRGRLAERLGIDAAQLHRDWPDVGTTVHAIAYRLLGLERGSIVTDEDRAAFSKHEGLRFDASHALHVDADAADTFGLLPEAPGANQLFAIRAGLSARRLPLDSWRVVGSATTLHPEQVPVLLDAWAAYQRKVEKCDFEDLLERAIEERLAPDAEYLIADEAQDLSPLQHALLRTWRGGAERVLYAGDPHQAIYEFAGATPERLAGLGWPTTTLPVTYRIPAKIWAACQHLINRTTAGRAFSMSSAVPGGDMRTLMSPEPPQLVRVLLEEPGCTFMLARSRRQVRALARTLVAHGVPFAPVAEGPSGPWTETLARARSVLQRLYAGEAVAPADAQLFLASQRVGAVVARGARRRFRDLLQATRGGVTALGEDVGRWSLADIRKQGFLAAAPPSAAAAARAWLGLNEVQREALETHLLRCPRAPVPTQDAGVRVGTIHSAKGKAADTVILFLDLPRVVARETLGGWSDPEARIYYVGATRARRRLILVRGWWGGTPFDFSEVAAS